MQDTLQLRPVDLPRYMNDVQGLTAAALTTWLNWKRLYFIDTKRPNESQTRIKITPLGT